MDAHSRLLKLMETQGAKNNPTPISLAVVVSCPPNLIIQTGDVQIAKENILISDILLNTYSRQIEIPSTSTVTSTVTNSNGTSSINSIGLSGQINFTDTLRVGDQLAVQEIEDGQTFIILCRVVKLDG